MTRRRIGLNEDGFMSDDFVWNLGLGLTLGFEAEIDISFVLVTLSGG